MSAVPIPPHATGALPVTDAPKLLVSQFLEPPSEEAGPEGSTGSQGTAPIDTINHFAGIGFDIYGNDIYGTCVPAAISNLIRMTSGYYTGVQIQPSLNDAFDFYRRANPDNAGFVPDGVGGGPYDNGCYTQVALDELLHNGIGGGKYGLVKSVAHATVDVTNDAQLKQAMQIFGGLLYQFELSQDQDDAWANIASGIPDEWDQYAGADKGPHEVMAGAYEPTELQDVITWDTRVPTAPAYRRSSLSEAWIVIFPWTLEHPNFQAGVNYDALAAAYFDLTGRTLPPRPTPSAILARWKSGKHVGAAKPRAKVLVRRGHYHRRYSADHVWEAVWVADSDWTVLPNIRQITTEQSFDSNGVTVATIEMDNIGYITHDGVAGEYRKIERGWFSPLRAYRAPGRPNLNHTPNEWDRLLTDSVEIHVSQGYGDELVPTFSGLVDSATVGDLPDQITLSCRDFGLNLVDSRLFGWNIDPDKRDPITFYDKFETQKLLRSKAKADRDEGARRQKKGVVVADVADMVTLVCRWGGFNVDNMDIHKTGRPLGKQSLPFDRNQSLMDVISKVCDLTGYVFYMEPASAAHPNGRPVFRFSNAARANPPILTEVRDDQMLTGVQYQTDNTVKASIIRVRGKIVPAKRGGIPLGGDKGLRLTGVYRPPWHKTIYLTGTDRDARVLRHVIVTNPLLTTQHECDTNCIQIALAMALAATTATIEVPGYPAFILNTVLNLMDRPSGLNTRVWLLHVTGTQTFGQTGTYKMSLGLALLDNPDVVEVNADLHQVLREPNE